MELVDILNSLQDADENAGTTSVTPCTPCGMSLCKCCQHVTGTNTFCNTSRTTSYPIYETNTKSCSSKDVSVMLVNRPLKNCQKYAQITVSCLRRDADIFGQFRRRCLLLVVNFFLVKLLITLYALN